jgi:hypothetical protein
MRSSTRFRRLHAHRQELKTALTVSGFTVKVLVVAVLLVVAWLVVLITSQTTTNNAATINVPTVKPEAVNAVLSSWRWAWRRLNCVERHINLQVKDL